MSLDTLDKLCGALKCEPGELLERDNGEAAGLALVQQAVRRLPSPDAFHAARHFRIGATECGLHLRRWCAFIRRELRV